MRFGMLLWMLSVILKVASRKNADFKRYIAKAGVRVLVKTQDGRRGRLFIFDRGRVRSMRGDSRDFDVALVWSDSQTGFSVMTDKRSDAFFNAAAAGKLRVEGMSVYAQWFETGMKLVL
jgi:hypothetical protein